MSEESKYEGFRWIKVKRYTDDPLLSWEERYRSLEIHHIEETTFLIDEIRQLAAQIDKLKQQDQVRPEDQSCN